MMVNGGEDVLYSCTLAFLRVFRCFLGVLCMMIGAMYSAYDIDLD